MIDYSIELGLLYIHERRFDEADARFAKLEREQFPREMYLTRSAGLTGRLGRAVVATYRDGPNAPQQSNDLFLKALVEPFTKLPGKGDRYERGYQAAAPILLHHLDLSEAISDALNRNAMASARRSSSRACWNASERHPKRERKSEPA